MRFQATLFAVGCATALVVGGMATEVAAFDREASDPGGPLHEEAAHSVEQAQFADLLAYLLDEFPDVIVDFYWDGRAGHVVTTTDSAKSLIDEASRTDIAEVRPSEGPRVPYLERSDVELAVLDEVDPSLVSVAAARYEASSGVVEAEVWVDRLGQDAYEQVVRQIPATVEASDNIHVPIRPVIRHDDPPIEHSRGGEDYGTCTGGFIGDRGSAYGIITAAHCTSTPPTYDGDATGSTFVATDNYDLRFTNLSGGSPQNSVRAGSTTYTSITSTGVVSPGMNIAKYGRSTGYGTTTVDVYQGCVAFASGNTWCGLYQTTAPITQGGDSGGPWFFINTAYAVTTGGSSSGSFITPIAYISSISGNVWVRTS